MASANTDYTEIVTTTIEKRSRSLADNTTNNNAILSKLSMRGNIKTFSGGTKIIEEMHYTENANVGWYSGYDILPVGTSEVISASEYPIKQCAVAVVCSGLEQLQNSGQERMIDLLDGRVTNAESSMENLISEGLYSNGTGAGNKQIDGLLKAVSLTPAASAYGNIDPSVFTFWQNAVNNTSGLDATTVQAAFNATWAQLVRGRDRPDLIMVDNGMWEIYLASLQNLQRFTGVETAQLGFPSIKYMDADVVLDGGIYKAPYTSARSGAPANTAYFLNTKYLHYRPHADRNMRALAPQKRYATNQDAEVQLIGWAGNLTCSGRMFQGILDNN